MKGNKLQASVAILSVAIILFSFSCLLFFKSSPFCSDSGFGCDMKHRRAEVLCSHKGVNPFHVWTQDVKVDGFLPMNRPDRPHVEIHEGDLVVHDYPVWHTVWFWWYGLLPESVCIGLVSLLFGISVSIFVARLWFDCKRNDCSFGLVLLFTAAMAFDAFWGCFSLLNYGVLLVAALLLMVTALEHNKQVLAGICWAFVMIKPQVGLLFFFPLLFSKKYRTILTACFVCLAMTTLMAMYYHESPFDLLIQIPQIGEPYQNSPLITKVLKPLLGMWGQTCWMILMGSVCAYASYKMRKCGHWLLRLAPALLCFPVWTYSNGGDSVIRVLWFAVIAMVLFCGKTHRVNRWVTNYAVYSCIVTAILSVWTNFSNMGMFNTAGRGWIYHAIVFLHFVVSMCCLQLITNDGDRFKSKTVE